MGDRHAMEVLMLNSAVSVGGVTQLTYTNQSSNQASTQASNQASANSKKMHFRKNKTLDQLKNETIWWLMMVLLLRPNHYNPDVFSTIDFSLYGHIKGCTSLQSDIVCPILPSSVLGPCTRVKSLPIHFYHPFSVNFQPKSIILAGGFLSFCKELFHSYLITLRRGGLRAWLVCSRAKFKGRHVYRSDVDDANLICLTYEEEQLLCSKGGPRIGQSTYISLGLLT